MDCTTQIKHWFYICLALIGLILFLVTMFMNYNLTLDGRTTKLEKKNGKELKRIEELEKKNGKELAEIEKINKRVKELERKSTHEK